MALARALRERFICVQQMQDLGFKKEIIAFTGEENNINSSRFRHVIMRVEENARIYMKDYENHLLIKIKLEIGSVLMKNTGKHSTALPMMA